MARMTELKLSIATTDYDHFRDFRLGRVRAEGIDHMWSMLGHHEVFARFTANREWDVAELRSPSSCAQITAQRLRHRRPAGDLLAAVPLLVVLRQQERQDPRREGPEGQARRLARMGAFRRRLHARLDAQRGRREAEGRAMGSGRRQRGRGAMEKVELSLPKGVQAHPHRRQVAVRDAGARRDRLRHHRAPARLLPRAATRTWSGCIPISWRWRRTTTQRTKVWPIMHIIAHAEAHPRRQPVGGAQSLQRVPRVQAPQRRAAARPRRVALSARLAADLCAQDAGHVRRRSLPVRHRGEPRRPGSRCCSTPTSRASPTGTSSPRTSSPRAS